MMKIIRRQSPITVIPAISPGSTVGKTRRKIDARRIVNLDDIAGFRRFSKPPKLSVAQRIGIHRRAA
jgi:hypothetical protein